MIETDAPRAIALLLDAVGHDSDAEAVLAAVTAPEAELRVGRAAVLVASGASIPAPPVARRLEAVGPARPVRPVIEGVDLPVRRRRAARAFLWVRNCGLVVILFVAYQLWGTGFAQARAQESLRKAFASVAPAAETPTVDAAAPVHATTTAVPSLPGGVVAHLQIPAIHLDQYVVEGTGVPDLRKGPGHYAGTPLPGAHGNAAIAGHRTTYGAPFNRLDELHPGDVILTTTSAGTATYTVAGSQVVSPTATSVVDDFGDDRLTLTTCTPKFSAAKRLVVVALLTKPAPADAGTPPRTAPPPPQARRVVAHNVVATKGLRADEQSFQASALPGALLVALGLGALGLAYRPLRRRLPPLATAVVLAPLWLAGLLLLFEHLTRFLPANV